MLISQYKYGIKKILLFFHPPVMEAQGPQATVLVDILHFEYGKTLTELRRFEEARHAFSEVVENPNSPHREAAALLIAKTWDAEGKPKPAIKAYERFLRRWPASPTVRDTSLRLAQLLIKKRRGLRAVGILTRIFRQSPNSRAGKQAKRELAKLAKSGMRSARLDLPASRMNHIGWLLSDRRFRDALAPTLKHLAWAKGAGQRFEVMRALNILSRIYEETRQEAKALEIYAEIRKRNGFGPTLSKKMRLLALAGKYAEAEALLDKRHKGSKSRLYWKRLADFRYRFGRYKGAFEAYRNAQRRPKKRNGAERLNLRMAWCLLAMGQAERAVEYFKKKRARKLRDRMGYRYWHGRALQMAGRHKEALEVYDRLVARWPHKYYAILAYSRALEMRGKAPGQSSPVIQEELLAAFSAVTSPKATVPALESTVFWSNRSMNAPYTDSDTPQGEKARLYALARLVGEWGDYVPEAHRALELARLGFHQQAMEELRVIEGDIRAAKRYGPRGVIRRARADLLDNRAQKRARGGASLRDRARRTNKEGWAFARRARKIQPLLRAAQSAYGDFFSLRRRAIADRRRGRRALTLDASQHLKRIYPIAFPELVQEYAKRNKVPPYFLYSIMSVESSFHPHPVSVAHAYGLLQVIPRTGRRIASEIDFPEFSPELLLRPEVSIPFGSYYLGQLLKKFEGQELLAAAAYNGGPHRVEAWLRANPNRPMDLFVDNIPFGQSRGYARTVVEKIARYRFVYHGEERIYVSNVLKTKTGALPNY